MWPWAVAILVAAVLAAAWGLFGFALRAECDGDECTVGPTVDLIAAIVAAACVAAGARAPRARPALYAVATLVLIVPVARSLTA